MAGAKKVGAKRYGNQVTLGTSRHALKLIRFVGPLSVFYELMSDNTSENGGLEFKLADQTIARFVRADGLFVLFYENGYCESRNTLGLLNLNIDRSKRKTLDMKMT